MARFYYAINAQGTCGTFDHCYASNKRDAIWRAERLFNRGDYTRIEVTRRTENGGARRVHLITAPLTAADIAARQASYPKARED